MEHHAFAVPGVRHFGTVHRNGACLRTVVAILTVLAVVIALFVQTASPAWAEDGSEEPTGNGGTLTICKEDPEGNRLRGAEFKVEVWQQRKVSPFDWHWDEYTTVKVDEDDDDGCVTLENLPEDKYRVTETKVPEGYELDPEAQEDKIVPQCKEHGLVQGPSGLYVGCVRWGYSDLNMVFFNRPIERESITIVKVDPEGQVITPEACFEIDLWTSQEESEGDSELMAAVIPEGEGPWEGCTGRDDDEEGHVTGFPLAGIN